MDIVQPVMKKRVLGWDDATLNLACRLEYVDWNVGQFNETGDNIGDDLWSIMPAISFRPYGSDSISFKLSLPAAKRYFGQSAVKNRGIQFWYFNLFLIGSRVIIFILIIYLSYSEQINRSAYDHSFQLQCC